MNTETKICSKCHKELSIDDFGFRNKEKNIRRSDCKKCHSEYCKRRYHNNKITLDIIKKETKCKKCGYDRCVEALEYHHKEPNEKIDEVSKLATHYNLNDGLLEIEKCVLLCANCHREFHFLAKNIENFNISNFLNNEYNDNIFNKDKEDKNNLNVLQIEEKNKKEVVINREILKELIRTLPFVQIGKKYKVSDNAIRKWCVKMNLPKTKSEINSYSDEEWNLI